MAETLTLFEVRYDTHLKGRNRYQDLPSIKLGEFHMMDIVIINGEEYKITGFGLGTSPNIWVEKADYISPACG